MRLPINQAGRWRVRFPVSPQLQNGARLSTLHCLKAKNDRADCEKCCHIALAAKRTEPKLADTLAGQITYHQGLQTNVLGALPGIRHGDSTRDKKRLTAPAFVH